MYDIRRSIINLSRPIKLLVLRSRFTVINRAKINMYDNRGWYNGMHSKIKSKDRYTIDGKIYVDDDIDGYPSYPTSTKTINELCEEDDDYY